MHEVFADEERWAEVLGTLDEELPFGEDDPEPEETERFFFIISRVAPGGNLFQATRAGDLERVKYLLGHESTDVNALDEWDCPPLYYACLAGHYNVAEQLLEGGAQCNEHTFDGDRIHYVSLNLHIRNLLRRYEARPPPLAPLATSMRQACSLCAQPSAGDEAPRPTYTDLVFVLNGERFELHRAILAARSPYYHKMLRTAWVPARGEAVRTLAIGGNGRLTREALRAILVYLYTDRLDVEMDEAGLVEKLAQKLQWPELQTAVAAERERRKCNFKRARKGGTDVVKRLLLRRQSLPPQAQLPAHLRQLRGWAAAEEERGNLAAGADFADVLIAVEGHFFRCHRVILAARSLYFSALLQRSDQLPADVLSGDNDSHDLLPAIKLGDVTADVFEVVLAFMYTHEMPTLGRRQLSSSGIDSLLSAADMYLLEAMQRAIADAVINDIEQSMREGTTPSLEYLLRLMITADEHVVPQLRDPCLVAVAMRWDAIALGEAPPRDCLVLAEFIRSVAPKEWSRIDDLLEWDVVTVAGASGGNIEGGGVGGLGFGTLLQDLRESYLEHAKAEPGAGRDQKAALFDKRLQQIAAQTADNFE